MTYDELAKEIHDDAVAHGWWDTERSADECIALMHCELSEAVEELRNGHAVDEIYYNGGKPEGFAVEIADCVIRVLDFMAHNNQKIDAEKMGILSLISGLIFAERENKPIACILMCHQNLVVERTDFVCDLTSIISICEAYLSKIGIDLKDVMRLKMDYNKTRPYKHGKEF